MKKISIDMKKISAPLFLLLLLLLQLPQLFLPPALGAQVDFDELNFQESLREGVVRAHRGNYNEAIISLLRSLSFRPNDYLAREWLGRAYYFSGYEEAALNEWRQIRAQAPPFLQSFIAAVEARWSLAYELGEDQNFLVVEEFQSEEYTNALVNPGGMVSDGDGNFFLNSFGTNNVNYINQNGRLIRNLTGGLMPLSGPFDIELYEDQVYVTNFLGDYVSVLNTAGGGTALRFGSAGIGDGEFLGPQYISRSEEPAIYVSDVGNQRVTKFTLDGEYLFHFGEPPAFRTTPSIFEGFTRIGGLAAGENGVYVANNLSEHTELLFFDNSGNILERFILEDVSLVEDLTLLDDGKLIITSRTAVYLFDPLALSVETLYLVNENENAQFVSARFDDNTNLLISDFRNDRLLFLSRLSGVYSGYHVEIHRIDSSNFPRIFIELSVRDILGNNVLGLQTENFIFTEEGLPLNRWSLEYSGSSDSRSSAAFIIEASTVQNDPEARSRQETALYQALESLPAETSLSIFSAGISPVMIYDNGNPADLPGIMSSISVDREWKIDQAIRLAGDRLLQEQSKREIVFLSNGNLPDWAFDTIGLSQTLAYLRNNHIRFNLIDISRLQGIISIDPALNYLVEQSGGIVYTLDDARSIAELGKDFLRHRTGLYMFSAVSGINSELGRRYIPLEAEIIHFSKSGRDELGYFAPLEF